MTTTNPEAPARQRTDNEIFAAMEPQDSGSFANNTTPLIRNCWYACARSTEIGRTPLARKLLGVDVVLYRTLDGAPVALRNRCPHRSFPLAKGKLVGDKLVCGYHGMEFGTDGVCAKLPALANVPATAAVRTFPIADRGPLTWIWMGAPDLADEALIPDTWWLSDPEWGTVSGDFHINADYVSMHENLIDQTHFPFLHPDTVGTPEYARSKLSASTEDNQVVIRRELLNSSPPGVYGKPAQIMDKRVDRTSEARFVSPALHTAYARVRVHEPDEGKPALYRYNITHVFTPETNDSMHYWWFNSRDYLPGDADIDGFMLEAHTQAYSEDVEALQWINEVVRTDGEEQFDLSFAPDKPGLMARRIMYRLAMAEAR
ncbi:MULTISPECIES: aromatic ring-hydroxylating dioxygenase subunit alpha [unclassified Novosphingobium]|uniref:aromatic ring-hydroxylating dioxygenase subunit alpha n=1 Tax=unclassified Novosphingobium TaxID=2644732 RepID=UPI0006C86665|nr:MULTISPECIES: aromatic ring-hydroxylating dioxygenase subunit alpha [unclassified Novosphingobium]TCM26011.1 vanillate O-demethylase monooxygenase subunit [Novosphingobium sp. ST904]WRT95231.1 aromatic ring-hydroxylating dioxygenase subunit alpha [Novosphingobium sp. RL4]